MTSISPPVYEQIAQTIRRQILDGDLTAGSRIPSESILCEQFSVTRGTVRRALQVLVSEGYLRSYQGKGTFVTSQPRGNKRPRTRTRLGSLGGTASESPLPTTQAPSLD